MKNKKIYLPLELYEQHLTTISGIRFTSREIDILACMLNGRTAKTIPSFLSISPKTVTTHMANMRGKIGCSSRESIIDFVENSDKLTLVKHTYYSSLATLIAFEKILREISKISSVAPVSCCLIDKETQHDKVFAHYLESHLKLIKVKLEQRMPPKDKFWEYLEDESNAKDVDHIFVIGPNSFNASRIDEGSEKLPSNIHFIQRGDQKSYYVSFFKILKILFPSRNIETFIKKFNETCNRLESSEVALPIPPDNSKIKHLNGEKENFHSQKKIYPRWKKWAVVSVAFFIGAMSLYFFIFKESKYLSYGREHTSKNSSIHSELAVPTESTFLNRSELITQLDRTFKGDEDIQSTALVGIGGAGKTTLARQYAHQQKASVIWEINAETQESLKNSFEDLTGSLSKTEEDQKILRGIQDIKNSKEKEDKILEFVKEHLRQYPNWFLIYDNVEQFTDIQNYFPQDYKVWGQGKIILTTRNINIQNNRHIGHVVLIGEFNQKQKLELFTKIVDRGSASPLTPTQQKETQIFLENIPPFPLDVSVAAYYVKSTNLPYDKYLKHLETHNKDFIDVQKNLLKEAGTYLKTRYGIITLSLEQLIKNHKDFTGLLLFISLLDSQNIPRDLLNTYKDETVVDNFIYHLKKYSLITANSVDTPSDSAFSIHRSTQSIILAHLIKMLDLGEGENNKPLENISNLIENYVASATYKVDLFKIKKMLGHCKTFLSHSQLLNEDVKARISGELGAMYWSQCSYGEAKAVLHESLSILKKNYKKNSLKIAKYTTYLGNIYRELGEYEKAKNLFEQSLSAYQQHNSKDYEGLAQTLGYLGITYKNLGHYENAKNLLEKTVAISKKHLPETHVYIAFVLAELGVVYKRLGHYEQAKKLLEQSLMIYRNDSKNHVGVSWVLSYLGIIEQALGNYEKAKVLFEEGLEIYKQHYPENHMRVARMFVCLGDLYRECGDYKQAKSLLEKGLNIYNKYFVEKHLSVVRTSIFLGALHRDMEDFQEAKKLLNKSLVNFEKHYGEGHIETAPILENLGQVYLLEGDIKTAEVLLNQALSIFQNNNHPDEYKCLESLSTLYIKKAEEAKLKSLTKEAQEFKIQAMNSLQKAFEIMEVRFPVNSTHLRRIKSKIAKLGEGRE